MEKIKSEICFNGEKKEKIREKSGFFEMLFFTISLEKKQIEGFLFI